MCESVCLARAILHTVRPNQKGFRQHVETRLTFGKCQNPFPKTGEEIKTAFSLEKVRSAFPKLCNEKQWCPLRCETVCSWKRG